MILSSKEYFVFYPCRAHINIYTAVFHNEKTVEKRAHVKRWQRRRHCVVERILIPTTVRARARFLYDRKYVSTATAKRIILLYYLYEFIFYTTTTTARPSPMVALQRREVHAKKFVCYKPVVLPFYFYNPCVSKTVVVLVVLLIAVVVVSIIKKSKK